MIRKKRFEGNFSSMRTNNKRHWKLELVSRSTRERARYKYSNGIKEETSERSSHVLKGEHPWDPEHRISREFRGKNRGKGGWRQPKETVIHQKTSLENNFIRGNECNRGSGMYHRMNNLWICRFEARVNVDDEYF